MAKIAFILLCHKDPEGIIRQAERLTATGDAVAIHFDARAPAADFARLQAALGANAGVVFAPRRRRCGWGEWSLVAATLDTARAALDAFPDATHVYMLSGDCMPIKSAEYAHAMLDADDADHIESFDFFTSDWIRVGLREDRLHYRHWFNERSRRRLFYLSYEWQKRLGLSRRPPADLQMMIGSQWWCLRRRTIEAVLAFAAERRDVLRFFRTTWIPDETFVQTIVHHVVPLREIRARTLTFLMFTDYGMPVTFHNDHYELLRRQDYLFARKISPQAQELKARLGDLWAAKGAHFPISNEGRSLFAFLTGKGRIGRRFAPRFWERKSNFGRDRVLMIIVCKKWQVAQRLAARARDLCAIPCVGYLFNEEKTAMPDLGGVQTTLAKRNRHRRALIRMLFDYHDSNRLVICIDPSGLDLLHDFTADKSTVRILEIDCDLSDAFLTGHARRVGLAAENTPPELLAELLPTLRFDLKFESARIRDSNFPGMRRIREGAAPSETASALAAFFGIGEDRAREIAAAEGLYDD